MTTITIPKNLISQKELTVIPKQEYDQFNAWKKSIQVNLEDAWFWSPKWQKKEAEADKAIRTGRVSGPFSTHKNLVSALRRKKK